MKTIMKIAEDCDLMYNTVKNCIVRNNLVLEKINGKSMLNKYQEDYIHQALFLEGKITEITLESKLNQETENE